MTLPESVLLAVLVIAAAVVAVLVGDVPPVLAGILGVALGYIGKAAVNASPLPTSQEDRRPVRIRETFHGAPPE